MGISAGWRRLGYGGRFGVMHAWRFGVLGPVVAERDNKPIQIRGPRQRGLLAYLVLHPNRVVTTAQLVDALWGDNPPATATKTVQVFVSRLRRDLGTGSEQVLETHANGYRFVLADGQSDIAELDSLVERARAMAPTDPEAAASLYADALALWRGTPLADAADASFVAAAAAVLEELRHNVLERHIEAQLAQSRHNDVIPVLHEAVATHPLREGLRMQLATALYRSGRQSEALSSIRHFRKTLGDELGLDPGPELQELEQRILRQDASLLAPRATTSRVPEAAPPVVPAATASGVPALAPSFRRRRRRGPTVAACLVLTAGAVVATVIAAWPHAASRGVPLSTLRPGSVAVVDGAGHVVADVPVGSAPGPVAITPNRLWVGDLSDHTVTEIDVHRASVVKRYGLPASPVSLTTQGDHVWIGNGFEGTLSRILVSYEQLSAPYLPDGHVAGLLAVTAGSDRLWVGLADRQVVMLNPEDLHIESAATLPQRIAALAALPTAAIAIPMVGSDVMRIDSTGASTRLATLPGRPKAVAVAFGSVWVATSGPNRLVRLDPSNGATQSQEPLADPPTAIAAGARALWVEEAGDELVEHVPVDGSSVRSELRIGYRMGGITADDRYLYLSVTDHS